MASARPPLRERYLDIEGQRLRIVTRAAAGSKVPPLLIFNGIGAAADLLQPLLDALPGGVVTFDLPGIGASRAALVPRRMSGLAGLARAVLRALAIERCDVMGISWGGGLAQQFARQYPHVTRRLVLAATSSGHLMLPPRPRVMLRMATPWRYLSADYFRRIAGDIYGGDFRHDPDRVAHHARRMAPPSSWGYLSQLYALGGWTSLFWLHRLHSPTLVLAGEDDPLIPLGNARLLAARIPDARLEIYDCGHLFVLTRLDAVARHISEFRQEDTAEGRTARQTGNTVAAPV